MCLAFRLEVYLLVSVVQELHLLVSVVQELIPEWDKKYS